MIRDYEELIRSLIAPPAADALIGEGKSNMELKELVKNALYQAAVTEEFRTNPELQELARHQGSN